MKKIIQEDTYRDLGTVVLRCFDHCTMLVVDKGKHEWPNELPEIYYNICMQDSAFGVSPNTVFQRLKRAFKALFGKGVYYNDLYLNGEEQMIEFRDALNELIAKQ